MPFGPGPADLDLYLKQNVYQDEFASDLPSRTSAVLYATQRPDPFPRVFGYHEVFHALTLVAVACQYVAPVGDASRVGPFDVARIAVERFDLAAEFRKL